VKIRSMRAIFDVNYEESRRFFFRSYATIILYVLKITQLREHRVDIMSRFEWQRPS
jgi:hypothetical protein